MRKFKLLFANLTPPPQIFYFANQNICWCIHKYLEPDLHERVSEENMQKKIKWVKSKPRQEKIEVEQILLFGKCIE